MPQWSRTPTAALGPTFNSQNPQGDTQLLVSAVSLELSELL